MRYSSNFWRILEMQKTDREINLILNWSENWAVSNAAANQATTFAITDEKLYVLAVTLSTDCNGKLLKQLKSGFKRAINWNKYQSKTITQNAPNQYLDYLVDPPFQGLNRLFV